MTVIPPMLPCNRRPALAVVVALATVLEVVAVVGRMELDFVVGATRL